MRTVLLHSCCAPCSAAILEAMEKEEIRPVVFFFNPNIAPREEYEKRKAELVRHCKALGVEFHEGEYDHEAWLKAVAGLENEPERGKRCEVCFRLRLKAAAEKAKELGIDSFTTSLASSRWKSLSQVSAAGHEAETTVGVNFWDRNWRKGGLQDRRNALLKLYGFYNQTWCGCEFSKRDADRAREAKRASEDARKA